MLIEDRFYPEHYGGTHCSFCKSPIHGSGGITYWGLCKKHYDLRQTFAGIKKLRQMILDYYQEEFQKLSLPHTTMQELTLSCGHCQEQKLIEHPHIDFKTPSELFVRRHKDCKPKQT
jgi:hypothetical protein